MPGTTLRCPACSSDDVRVATEATIYQRATVDPTGDGLEYSAYSSDDVEMDDAERLLCIMCGHDEPLAVRELRRDTFNRWTKEDETDAR